MNACKSGGWGADRGVVQSNVETETVEIHYHDIVELD